MTRVTDTDLLVAAQRHQRPGISQHVAIVLGYAELIGHPLDPENFDQAAVILRAERLLQEDLPVDVALRTAVAEFATFHRRGDAA